MLYIWIFLGILDLVLLIKYRHKKNAVWGGLVLGIIIGLVWKIFSKEGWTILVKVILIMTSVGFIAEILPLIFRQFIKK